MSLYLRATKNRNKAWVCEGFSSLKFLNEYTKDKIQIKSRKIANFMEISSAVNFNIHFMHLKK